MNKKGFTLIELLAVIIILGILMLVAIPSVSNYINNSRKNSYVATAKELIKGAVSLVNSGELDEIEDISTTYYIPHTCIDSETQKRSPYGEIDEAYIVVTYNKNDEYDYYFYGKDTEEVGVDPITESSALSADSIKTGVENLNTDTGIGRRKNIKVFNSNCSGVLEEKTATRISKESNNYSATFIKGEDFIIKIKKLSGQSVYRYYSDNTIIKRIAHAYDEPSYINKTQEHIVSTPTSQTPIYAWFDSSDGTIYWWSKDDNPYLNEDASYMFCNLKELEYIDDLFDIFTIKTTNMNALFTGCSKLKTLDLSNFDTSQVTNMFNMFNNCFALNPIDVSTFETSNVTDMSYMFYHCESISSLDVSNFDTSSLVNMNYMFSGCKILTSLNLEGINTSNVINMQGLFDVCWALEEIDVSGFNTSNVEKMYTVFQSCRSIKHIDISNWDTSNAIKASSFFYSCESLESIEFGNNTFPNVDSIRGMFERCPKLERLDLKDWHTANVEDMYMTFAGCSSLTYLDISNFDTSKVTTMFEMFKGCSSLRTLNLSSFDTSNVTEMFEMFAECSSLQTIYVSNNFVTTNVTSMNYMFRICYDLVGGAGSTWQEYYNDPRNHAIIDGGPSNPGYFTLKV